METVKTYINIHLNVLFLHCLQLLTKASLHYNNKGLNREQTRLITYT